MTQVRCFKQSDLERLLEIHREQGFAYRFPPLNEFCAARVVENGNGPDTGLFLRKSAEVYLLIDPAMRADEKMQRLELLAEEGPKMAAQQGISEAYALVPPEAEAKMQKRLFQLGWEKKLWPMYAIQIEGD